MRVGTMSSVLEILDRQVFSFMSSIQLEGIIIAIKTENI